MSNQQAPTYNDTISLHEAVTITTNWRNYIGNFEPASTYIRAFNVPMEDITNLATFTTSPSVRAYLAMTVPGDITSLKIIIVPVDTSGNDILTAPVQESVDADATRPQQSTIFDFTTPCPQLCDVNSPLFQ